MNVFQEFWTTSYLSESQLFSPPPPPPPCTHRSAVGQNKTFWALNTFLYDVVSFLWQPCGEMSSPPRWLSPEIRFAQLSNSMFSCCSLQKVFFGLFWKLFLGNHSTFREAFQTASFYLFLTQTEIYQLWKKLFSSRWTMYHNGIFPRIFPPGTFYSFRTAMLEPLALPLEKSVICFWML